MTTQEIELLFKDLCARLPYGVKLQKTYDTSDPIELYSIDLEHRTIKFYKYKGECITLCDVGDIKRFGKLRFKPYLFPLSSMTVEQRCKAQNLLPNKCEISFKNSKITFYGEDCCAIKLEQFDKLFKFFDSQHVDYRGLIPMGLAIDATGLNIY